MFDPLPDRVDPAQLASIRRSLRGSLAISRMSRLAPLLVSDSGPVDVELVFDVDDERIPFVTGHLTATLELCCQRCLGSMELPLEVGVSLGIVSSHDQARCLPSRYEPLVTDEAMISLVEMVEDELLLVLPQVPMHGEAECPGPPLWRELSDPEAHEPQRNNPFAMLAQLKGKTS